LDPLTDSVQALINAEKKLISETQDFTLHPPSQTSALDLSRLQLPFDHSLESIENAQAQLVHQSVRLYQLETKCDSVEWKTHTNQLSSLLDTLKAELLELKSEITLLNQSRKEKQMEIAPSLNSLQAKMNQLMTSSALVEMANVELESRLAKLRV